MQISERVEGEVAMAPSPSNIADMIASEKEDKLIKEVSGRVEKKGRRDEGGSRLGGAW